MKIVIVGGVAAGASAAARLRRLDESAEIVLIERCEAISYANCGLPYHVGGVIPDRNALKVMDAEGFRRRFHVDVRTRCEAVSIDRAAKTVRLRRNETETIESYDRLVLATGANPVRIPLPGAPEDRLLTLTTLEEMDRVIARLAQNTHSALVIGGGFIGTETSENLRRRGLEVTLAERSGQLLSAGFDPEMSAFLNTALAETGVRLARGRTAVAWENGEAVLDDGSRVPADVVLMCIGVRPENTLARDAGLTLGPRGHISVDAHMRTSDPDIYAAGDVVEVADPLTGGVTAIALAGPASKQGRIAADAIAGIPDGGYRGTYGASIAKVGDLTAASVGLTERRARQAGLACRALYAHPADHASYYPGGTPIHLKLVLGEDGRILGAQAAGKAGADKRIDVIATALAAGMDACALAKLEVCYAPPYSSSRDPVNVLGLMACNVRDGLTDPVTPATLPDAALLLDVREPDEFDAGTLPGAVNIPLGSLRAALPELPKDRTIVTFCKVGQRGYFAERILRQHGFQCHNLSGGYDTWRSFQAAKL